MSLKIVGIAGTNGAGKDSVGLFLAKDHGFLFVSVSDLLRDELRRLGEPVDREHLRDLSTRWRREYGYGVLIDRALEVLEEATKTQRYEGLAIASLRNGYEVDHVHNLGGQVWWVDADPKLRFERIQKNAESRGRAGEDQKTFEQFMAEEAAEMATLGDEATLNMGAVKNKCDVEMHNGGASLELFEQEVGELVKSLV